MIIVQQAFRPRCMITLPELAAEALGSFLASDMKDRFGASHARLAELIPFAARLALECIGNSDASSLFSAVSRLGRSRRARSSRRCRGGLHETARIYWRTGRDC